MLTDPKGNQFTMTGDEIDRIGALVYANASPSPAPSYTASPAPSMSAMAAVRNTSFSRAALLRRPAQVAQTPSGSPSATRHSDARRDLLTQRHADGNRDSHDARRSPSPSACPPAMKAKCERLRDAIFLLYYVAVAAIVAIGLSASPAPSSPPPSAPSPSPPGWHWRRRRCCARCGCSTSVYCAKTVTCTLDAARRPQPRPARAGVGPLQRGRRGSGRGIQAPAAARCSRRPR